MTRETCIFFFLSCYPTLFWQTEALIQVSLALKSYLACLEIGVFFDDVPYRILPILVNLKHDTSVIRIFKVFVLE